MWATANRFSTRKVMTIVLAGILVAAGVLIVARQAFGESSIASSDLTATSSGIEITLDTYSLTSDGADFDFTIQLPEPAVASTDPVIVELPNTGTDLLLTNVMPHRSGNVGSSITHQPGMTSVSQQISLGPIVDPSEGIELTFTKLTFNVRDDQGFGLHEVNGEWSFRISAADVRDAMAQREALTVERVLESDGVSVEIERLEKGSDGLTVYWSVSPDSTEIHPAGPGLHLIMPDGSVVEQSRMTRLSETDWPVTSGAVAEFSVTFPVVPATDERVTIKVDPFVTSLGSSATAVILNPLGTWLAESFEAGGDRFKVSILEIAAVDTAPEGARLLHIEIANVSPIDEATVMFMGVGTKEPRVYDESGREYQIVSGSTGMRRLDSGEMGAGATTLTIVIPDDASPETLFVDTPELGKLLKGPWATEIAAP